MSIYIERDNLIKKYYPNLPKNQEEAMKFFPTQREYLVWLITINGNDVMDKLKNKTNNR